MPSSALTPFVPIAEGSEATPGAFNSRFQALYDDIGSVYSSINLSYLSNATTGFLQAQQGIAIGSLYTSDVTTAGLFINVDSNQSDYIYFTDSSHQRSTYVIGSRAGGTADGLNIWDASGDTMIASFSKQSIRFWQNVVGPVFDVGGALASTFNAGTYGVAGDSTESRIQAAILDASAASVARVYVPASMYPYSASSISFIHNIQMVREGGDWAVYDVWAYGARGNGTGSDTSAFLAALSGASRTGGKVYVPPHRATEYLLTGVPIDIPPSIDFIGSGMSATRLRQSTVTAGIRVLGGGRGQVLSKFYLTSAGTGIEILDNIGNLALREIYVSQTSKAGISIVTGSQGGFLLTLDQVRVDFGANRGYAFDLTGGTNWVDVNFNACYSTAATGDSIGYDLANIKAVLKNCSSDNQTTAYQLGARITMLGCVSENNGTGVNILGSGTFSIIDHFTFTDSTPISLNGGANMNCWIINPMTSSTVGSNSILVAASCTGNNGLIGGGQLDKAVNVGAGANFTNIGGSIVTVSRVSSSLTIQAVEVWSSGFSALASICSNSYVSSSRTVMGGGVWGSGLSIGNTTAGGTLIPAISSTSSKIGAFVVQGSASSFTIVTWAAAQPNDIILVTPTSLGAAVSSLSSGLVAHSHCTKAGQVEVRLSNVSTLAQNQSSITWFLTRVSPF